GGDGINEGWALAIDTAGSAYVTGVTTATNFPLHNPYQAAYGGGTFDGFVTKIISTTGVYTYAYSTYLGGAGDDEGWAIKVDSLGDAVLTGLTASPDFPRLNAYQPAYGGGPADAFLTSIRPDGTALLYSTYLGGVGDDEGYGLALDPAGGAVLTGVTSSPNFPTAPPAPIQAALRGPTDAFVTRFRPDGSQPVYSTYLGGDLTDAGWAVAVDSSGAAYVTGTTDSDNFPLQNATQANAGSEGDAFIAAVSPAGDALTYATYLGGEDYEVGTAIVVDNSQHLDLAGFTYSTAFPIAGPAPLQDLNRGESNAFVARIDLAAPVPPSPGPGGVDTGAGDQQAPAADGAFAVWEDNSGGTWDIRAKNLDTGQLYWVYQGPGDQRRPAASGDLVVWQDNRNGNWAIYAARFQQGAFSGPTPVALGPGDQIKPAVDHDLVLWQSSAAVLATTTPEDAVRWDVVGRVMSQTVSQPFTLTTAGTTNTNPAIGVAIPGGGRSGQPVLSLGAWQSRPYPPPPNSNWQINGAVAVESTPIPFAVPDGGRSRINPVVNGLDIIWQVSPPTPGAGPISGSGWDVGGGHGSTGLAPGVLPRTGNGAPGPGGPHPPAFGITVFTITTGLAAEPDPRLSDNNVVWQDYDPLQGAWAIKQTDIVTGTPFAVVAGLTAVPHPAISGPRVVWQETDPSTGNDVHGNVCGLNGQMCSPTPTAPPTQTALPSRTATATPTAIAFSDVHPSDYFYPAVEYLAARGVISGYADGTFRPYNQTTRAQMVKIVVLGFAKPISTPAGGGYTFADVPPTFPFFAVIETAAADQIVSGYNCGGPGEPCDTLNRPYFRPYANVTRGQLAKIDVVAAGWPLLNPPAGSFADVLPQTAFYTFVETAYCHGIISGYACGGPGEPCDNTNRPYARQYNPATRGQIAKIVYLSVTGAPACGGAP
ncbi:MAG TPA: S-layer homology domain-containing protein, partial [Chloroflexia bacterium]|nr:S-layer homology domain-containing protein [Chloroflexia bacterium]